MKVLVTGAAGFIGYHVARRLVETKRCEVLGLDNLNDYYPVELKRARLAQLEPFVGWRFVQADLADGPALHGLFERWRPDYVVHLGAQAGVRFSAEQPAAYVRSNVEGFMHVLEACRRTVPKHLVFASSSSVYGAGAAVPFREDANTDQPISFYGATKKSNELMAHSYAHLYGLRTTGLRFFTVYGPWGRPDMAPTLFTRAILAGEPIRLFNHGRNRRDFTYIDDIVDGVLKVLLHPPDRGATPQAASNSVPFQLFNLGHNRAVEVRQFVQLLESLLGKSAVLELIPPQPGDMIETCANIDRLNAAVGFAPQVTLETGLREFVDWYRSYYAVPVA